MREERAYAVHKEQALADYLMSPPHPGPVRGSRYGRGDPHGRNNVSRGINACMEAAAVAASVDFASEEVLAHMRQGLRSRCSTPFEYRASSPTPPPFEDSPVRQMPSLSAGYLVEYDEFRPGGKAGTGNIKNESEEVAYCLSPPPRVTKVRNRQPSRSPGRGMYELGSSKKDKGIKYAIRGAWASARALAKKVGPRRKRCQNRMGTAYADFEFADIGCVSTYSGKGLSAKNGRRLAPGGAPRSAWSGKSTNRTGVNDGCFGPALMLSDSLRPQSSLR